MQISYSFQKDFAQVARSFLFYYFIKLIERRRTKMDLSEIIKMIMKQEDCSVFYALYLYGKIQDRLRVEKTK